MKQKHSQIQFFKKEYVEINNWKKKNLKVLDFDDS